MNETDLTIFKHKDFFSEIDIHFARFITRFSAAENPDLFLAAALVSRATGNGDICLDLKATAGALLFDRQDDSSTTLCPSLDRWRHQLLSSPAVGRPGDACPLILDDRNRLYLYRYWEYEKKLADFIRQQTEGELQDYNPRKLKQSIHRLFPSGANQKIDWQKVAAVVAILKRFSVITGGPGSGKTFTLAGILALFLECTHRVKPTIYLAAPTGKAAARLAESIEAAKQTLDCSDAIKNSIPKEVYTLHRLLKPIADTPYFHRNADNPLTADFVVVDEASMVDLALMSKLTQAVTPDARLLLVGDKDQLASVEAGSVLGDICDRQINHGLSKGFQKKIEELTQIQLDDSVQMSASTTGLTDCITVLQRSFRFAPDSGIGGLSRAVNRGDVNACLAYLQSPAESSILWHEVHAAKNLRQDFMRIIVEGYRKYLTINDPVLAMEDFNRVKILCALKVGPFGVNAVNTLAEQVLDREGLISLRQRDRYPWYRGRPVLITKNDYSLGLFNGDIGITLADPEAPGDALYVYFPDTSGELKRFPPHRLSEHETVYAMTVHKSQGSEFDHIALLLPEKDNPLLTRELIYTALTRARLTVSVWGSASVLKAAITRKIERKSGLRDALWA
jgi:exodeoxyribonuclease V alpha subunit